MNRIISENMDKIRELCRQHRAKSLYLFGSAVTDDQFTGNSDIDLLVRFDSKYFKGISKTYFNLIGELEKTYYLQYMLNGKLKKISLKCASRKEAEKKTKEILVPLQTADTKEKIAVHIAEARNIVKQGKGALTKAWELYLNNPARPDSSEATVKTYERQWKRFKKWLEKVSKKGTMKLLPC